MSFWDLLWLNSNGRDVVILFTLFIAGRAMFLFFKVLIKGSESIE
jgi:hypothetical protein